MKGKPEVNFDKYIENRCIDYLRKNHKGKKNAIPHKLLATRLNIDPRTIRALISHLVTDHYIPIGSLSKSNVGIFYINTKEEMEQAHTELMSRSDKIILRAFALKQSYLKSIKDKYKPKLFDI